MAGFNNYHKADEASLTEGYVLTVECDQRPRKARRTLEGLLGLATFIVASGGLWVDPATGEAQEKLHLHWRLRGPASGTDKDRLKTARRWAAEIAGADPTNISIVHPIRWPGSIHRKGEPKLVQIIAATEAEIDLGEALKILQAAKAQDPPEAEQAGQQTRADKDGDPRTTYELITNIASGQEFHPSIVPLSARLIGGGTHAPSAVNFIRDLLEAIPPEQRDERWQSRFGDVPRIVKTAEEKFGTGRTEEAAAAPAEPAEPLFDPWDDYVVPKFPLDVLPASVQRFVIELSAVIGCDPSALAMACLANFSGSLDHRFGLKLMRNGEWWASPRLWVLLVGDPSRKKTPVINTALVELEAHQNRIRDAYEAQLAEHKALLAGWDKRRAGLPRAARQADAVRHCRFPPRKTGRAFGPKRPGNPRQTGRIRGPAGEYGKVWRSRLRRGSRLLAPELRRRAVHR